MTLAAFSLTHGVAVSDDMGAARPALVTFLNSQEHLMTPPPAACTTAAAIRTEALAPALDLIAITQIERRQLAAAMAAIQRGERGDAASALRRLADLFEQRDAHARRIAGFVDRAAERLDYAERMGSYDAVVDDLRNGRQIAARLRAAIDTLAGPAHDEHAQSRADLHALFTTFGDEVFSSRVACHLGKQRTLALRGEYGRWKHPNLRASMAAGARLAEGSRIVAERIAAHKDHRS